MTKAELEKQMDKLVKQNNGHFVLICRIKKFIETNLQPFKDNIADYEDERNKGVLAVLNKLVDIYNTYSNIDKIEPLETRKDDIVKLKLIKGGKSENLHC